MVFSKVQISLINIATAVSFGFITLTGAKLSMPMFFYMFVTAVSVPANDLPFQTAPHVANAFYNYSVILAFLVLLFNGFSLKIRWWICIASSIWLFAFLLTPTFNSDRLDLITLIEILVFSILNVLALIGNFSFARKMPH